MSWNNKEKMQIRLFYDWHYVTLRREHRLNVVWLGGRCAEGALLARWTVC